MPLRAVGVFAAVVVPFSLSPMTLNGTERPHSTNGHLEFGNEAHVLGWEVLSREFRLDKLLDIRDEVLWQNEMRDRNSGLGKGDYVVARDVPGTKRLDRTHRTQQGDEGHAEAVQIFFYQGIRPLASTLDHSRSHFQITSYSRHSRCREIATASTLCVRRQH